MRFACTALLCLLVGTALVARPYTIDDMLGLEDYGRALFDPAESLVVVERLRPHAEAGRYSYDYFTRWQRSNVMVAKVAGQEALVPLFAQETGAGYWLAGFSPSGRRLAVYRLKDDRIDLGIVDMASRRVTWSGLAPVMPASATNPVWRDDEHVILVVGEAGALPVPLDYGGHAQKLLPTLWKRQAEGREDSAIIYESGQRLRVGTMPRQWVVELDVATNAARRLAEGNFTDLSLAPNGRTLALVERGADVPAPTGPFPLDFQSRRLRLSLLALGGGQVRRICAACDLAPDLLSWSGDGRRLLFLARMDGADWSSARLRVADAATGLSRTVALGTISPVLASTTPGRLTGQATWHGRTILFLGTAGDNRNHWYRVDPDRKGSPTDLGATAIPAGPTLVGVHAICLRDAKGYRRLVHGRAVSRIKVPPGLRPLDAGDPFADGTRLAPSPFRDGRMQFVAGTSLETIDCAAGKVRTIAALPATDHLLAFGDRTGARLALRSRPDGSAVLLLGNARARPIDQINLRLADVDKPRLVPLHRHSGGQAVTDWLLLPPSGDGPLPMVVLPYPGQVFGDDTPPPGAGIGSFSPAASPALLAAAGYAVFLPSMPVGTQGPADDILSAMRPALDAALATGYVDPQNVAVFGHSYGGYAALVLATRTNWFKAVIASAAAADLSLSYGAWDPRLKADFPSGQSTLYEFAWAETGQGRMQSPPWKTPRTYSDNSSYYALDHETAPILLLHGELDPVPVLQSERLFASLYRLGRDARLMIFSGEGHVPASPANIRLRDRAVLEFLDRYLGAGAHPGTRFGPNARR